MAGFGERLGARTATARSDASAGDSLDSDSVSLRRASAVLATFPLGWVVLIAVLGGVQAARVLGLAPSSEQPTGLVASQNGRAALIVLGLCLVAALVTRWLRPALTLPVTGAVGGIVVLAGAVAMGAVGALLAVSLLGALAWLVGGALLRRVAPAAEVGIVRAPIAIALGLGILGLLLLLPAAVGQLNFASVALLAGGLLLLLALDRGHLHAVWAALRGWRAPRSALSSTLPMPLSLSLSWFETAIIGLTVGLVAFALLTAFVPEIQTDAMRQHLPIAREIWQSGSVAEISPMNVSGRPMQGHLLYGVAYGLAGVTGAKLVQVLVGLTAIAGVAGIGWLGAGRGAGRTAAIVSAAIFATAPIVLWELGHAFLDLFPVLYTVTAALCILIWIGQRQGATRWLILAGALCGFGFAAKLNMGLLSVAFAAGIGLVGREPWRWRERVLAVATFGVGHLVILPWLLRDVLIGGDLHSPRLLLRQFGGLAPQAAPADPAATDLLPRTAELVIAEEAGEPPLHGFGRSPLDLLRGPWVATFRGGELGYPIIGRGEIGIAPLMLLPLALLGPRGRASAFLAVVTVGSYIGWWLTEFQIARHLLPTLALLAALGGIGVAGVTAAPAGSSPARRALATAARAGVLFACALVPIFLLASPRAQTPLNLFLGRESATNYVRREVPSAVALLTSSAILPPDTRLGYVSIGWEGPQLYTEARLIYFSVAALGSTPDEVLAGLDDLGIRHFIWNRERTSPEQNGSTLLSTAFLREHTRILAGDRNGYLFEILPDPNADSASEPGTAWGAARPKNLLDDPDLKRVRRSRGAWEVDGKIEKRRGAVSLSPRAAIQQRVPATPGAAYLLTATVWCDDPLGRAELALRWFDAQGAAMGGASEAVKPGVERSEQFFWRLAPANAASVAAEVMASKGSRCDITRVELNALDPP